MSYATVGSFAAYNFGARVWRCLKFSLGGAAAAEVKKAPLSLSLSSAQPLSLPKFENIFECLRVVSE